MVWGAAISAGVNIFGSLLGMGSQRKAEKRARRYAMEQRAYEEGREADQFVRMRDAAIKGGFNPSAVLRNGGSSGFQQHHSPSLSLSSNAGFIQGITDSISGVFQAAYDRDPLQDRRATLELDIMQAELNRIQNGQGRPGFGEAPTATGSRLEQTHGQFVSNPFAIDSGVTVDPNYPDAELAEARYGDIGQEIFGARNLYRDYVHNNPDARTRTSGVRRSRSRDVSDLPSDLGSVTRHFGSWMAEGLRRANERARFNNRFNRALSGW